VKAGSPKQQFAGFLTRFTPAVVADAKRALAKIRRLVPGATELVYDNYYALVIGFGLTERPSEAILSIVVFPRWVTLCFLRGTRLSDPHKLLKGSGNQVRNIRLDSIGILDQPAVQALIAEAVALAVRPAHGTPRRRMIIRAIAQRQRPRRPA